MERFIGIIGIIVLLGIAFTMSNNRKRLDWRLIIWGLSLQLLFALFILKTPIGQPFFGAVDIVIKKLLSFSDAGSDFLFKSFGTGVVEAPLMNFAFRVLPTIIFFSSLMAILYYLGLMQKVVKGIAWIMERTLKTSGAETLSVSANIFVGQTEAPLMIRPFVKGLTQSEIMAIMVGGFATVAGGVMAIYVKILGDVPGIAGHLMAASIMSAPAAMVVAKIIYPETEIAATADDDTVHVEKIDDNAMEALARGATSGLQLAGNVAAMLIAFVALIAMVNALLGFV
ncbi:MAG: NupC/NupG family nucleoside CNT transporter, partial [Candidatus Marinimicrobia bacterium]|nr:NupC/NupG family nucleoside CNT transporter [Candidatus Neomarinimicrobiota bacterium]